MTSFELIFFVFIVCPVITNNIHILLNSYKSKNPVQFNFDPNPRVVVEVLNEREYQLINGFNLNSYLIITILILLLISLLFYLYTKVGFIEKTENTEISPNASPNESPNGSENGSENRSENEFLNLVISSQNSNITGLTRNRIKFIYLKHAMYCAISTIICLIIYQIFFYNYGLAFKYVGTTDELIVLFIESIS